MSNGERLPEPSEREETFGTLATAVAQLVPGAGAAAVMLNGLRTTSEAKLNRFVNDVAERVERLEAEAENPAAFRSERFHSVLSWSLVTAARTADADKIELLKNAVINSARVDRFTDHDLDVLMALVENLVTRDVLIVRYFFDPRASYDAHGRVFPVPPSPGNSFNFRDMSAQCLGVADANDPMFASRFKYVSDASLIEPPVQFIDEPLGLFEQFLAGDHCTALGKMLVTFLEHRSY